MKFHDDSYYVDVYNIDPISLGWVTIEDFAPRTLRPAVKRAQEEASRQKRQTRVMHDGKMLAKFNANGQRVKLN